MKIAYSLHQLICLRHECIFYGIDVLDLLPLRNDVDNFPRQLPSNVPLNGYPKACDDNARFLLIISPSSYIVKVNGKVNYSTAVYLSSPSGDYKENDENENVVSGHTNRNSRTTGYRGGHKPMVGNVKPLQNKRVISSSHNVRYSSDTHHGNYADGYGGAQQSFYGGCQGQQRFYGGYKGGYIDNRKFKYLQFFEKHISRPKNKNEPSIAASTSPEKSVSDDELASSESISICINVA